MRQISLGILAWKSCEINGHYFGFGARLLTKNEDKAKGGESSELASQQVGELASWHEAGGS
jgi:hypothetical protein